MSPFANAADNLCFSHIDNFLGNSIIIFFLCDEKGETAVMVFIESDLA